MPTYEFECRQCNHKFELVTTMAKTGETTQCIQCGKTAHKKLSKPSGFILKGKGFYSNEYGNKKSKTN